jgi:taurine dioxygenase
LRRHRIRHRPAPAAVHQTPSQNRTRPGCSTRCWPFPDQDLSLEDLERIALHFGPFGSDPYFGSVPGHPHIAQVRRDADETTKIFAETWHSDWSFLPRPPQATLLYGNVIPPIGGDTLFANQYAAWEALSPAMKTLLQDKQGIHSARRGYARDGMYGEK